MGWYLLAVNPTGVLYMVSVLPGGAETVGLKSVLGILLKRLSLE